MAQASRPPFRAQLDAPQIKSPIAPRSRPWFTTCCEVWKRAGQLSSNERGPQKSKFAGTAPKMPPTPSWLCLKGEGGSFRSPWKNRPQALGVWQEACGSSRWVGSSKECNLARVAPRNWQPQQAWRGLCSTTVPLEKDARSRARFPFRARIFASPTRPELAFRKLHSMSPAFWDFKPAVAKLWWFPWLFG